MGAVVGFAVKALAVASAVGQGVSLVEQRKQQKKQEQLTNQAVSERRGQARQEARLAEIRNNRLRRQRIREFLLARGEQQNTAANLGVQGSSGESGGAGALQSQLAGQLGSVNQQQAGQAVINQSNERLADITIAGAQARGREAQAAQLGQVAGTIFQATGGFSEDGAIFKAAEDIFS